MSCFIALGRYEGNRFAHKPDFFMGQEGLVLVNQAVEVFTGHILCREHSHDTRDPEGLLHIDADESGMGLRAPENAKDQRPIQRDVFAETPPSGSQFLRADSRDRFSDLSQHHQIFPAAQIALPPTSRNARTGTLQVAGCLLSVPLA